MSTRGTSLPAAGTCTVAVVGGGIAGLTAAWELASAGAQVEFFEATDQLGGVISPVTLSGAESGPGVRVDAGAEAFATRVPAVREFLADLGLEDQIVSPNPAGAWLQLPELAAPMPATGILGIPGDPDHHDVAAILGTQNAARAAEDLSAPMIWAAEQNPSLGEVVADRMGAAVVEKLVAPITSGVHSADPYDLAISAAHPKLYQTMLARGSLASAVKTLRASAPAGSAVQSLRGGMNTLISALEDRLREFGVRIHLSTEIQGVRFHRNSIEMESIAVNPRPSAGSASKAAEPAETQRSHVDHAVLAIDGPEALEVLGGQLPGVDRDGHVMPSFSQPSAPSGVALVTLLVRASELDAHPRGTGVLVSPGVTDIRAKAMTHISAKWPWAAEELQSVLGPGYHLVRLSYGRITDQPGALGFGSEDEELISAAVEDLPRLTGVPIRADQIIDHTVVRWRRGLPGASAELRASALRLRETLAAHSAEDGPQARAVGAWFAGTGLAQVIPDARQQARRLLENL